jgi:predicted ATPase
VSSPALTLLDGVRWHGDPVTGERGHALLAALVLASPRAVGVGDLVDDVWADDEPEHPEKALQVLVSRTRARTAADAVVHTGTGYRIGLREDEVDALRLRRLVVSAREAAAAGDLDVVRLACLEAVAIEVATAAQDGPLGRLVAAAERDRAAAGRLLGRALLARGESAEALPLLESALDDDPADEQRLADVLRAEANVRGVPAALARYASYVEHTRESLGAEPGEDLRRLHAELLARDAPVREGLKYDAAPMVGRDHDVARIRTLLETSRVVSVVGPGRTREDPDGSPGRPARAAAGRALRRARGRQCGGGRGAGGGIGAGRARLGGREAAAGVTADLRSRIAQHLAGPPTLLILDNCEHLVDEVASLVAFLAATTESTSVLTTSRAPLGIAAERVYLLPQLDDTDAALLFRQRATAARGDVRLDGAQVAQLVARLDGLPLAIELAAAKVRVMSVAEIARRLEDRFTLLTGGDRSAPERHQTLEAVIDWSWNLLDQQERAALRALAMFPDGFSLEGADAVLGRDALSSVAELVDQSLVVVREGDDVRYRLLETVREYGLKQLAAAGGTDEVRGRLRAWAIGLARDLVARLFSPDQVAVMGAVRAEVGNLAGVMRAALADRDAAAVTPLVAVLGGFWTIEGEHLTVLGLSRPVLELLVEADTRSRGTRTSSAAYWWR